MKSILSKKAGPGKILQRKPFFSKEEGEGLKSSDKDNSFFSPISGQAKLRVGQSNDSYENEADSVADKVTDTKESISPADATSISKSGSPGIQKKSVSPLAAGISKIPSGTTFFQKQEEEVQESPAEESVTEPVQAKAEKGYIQRSPDEESAENPTEASEIPSVGGTSMDAKTQTGMESGFGADFSNVRIHTDSNAVAMNQSLNAQAFTQGSDIYFNEGKYNPGSPGGKNLLAHELTHTVQQGATEVAEPESQSEESEQKAAVESKGDSNSKEGTGENVKSAETKPTGEQPAEIMHAGGKTAAEPAEKQDTPEKAEKKGAEDAKKEDVKEGLEGKPKEKGKEKGLNLSSLIGEPKKEGSGGGGGTGGGGGGGARQIDMADPSLDGGPEKMQAETEAEKGEVDKELKAKSEGVYQKGIENAGALAANEKEKEDADTKLKSVEASVEIKPEEKQSEVNNKQVAKVDAVSEPQVKEEKAKEKFKDKVKESLPETLEDAFEFGSSGKGSKIGQAVGNIVEGDVQAVESTYKEVENTEKPEAPPPNTPLNEIEEAPETPALNMGDGLVPPVSEKQTDLTDFNNESDNLLQKEGITDEQLEMVDSGDLAEAKKNRKDVKDKTTKEPAKIKAFEATQQLQVKTTLQKEEKKKKDEMRAKRKKELTGAKSDQKTGKNTLEQKRKAVTDKINGIYETANKTVKEKLKNLKKTSLAAFDKAEKKSSKEFESNVKRRLKAFKKERYGGFWGGAKWLKDALLGMDDLPQVKTIFDTEKAKFESKIDQAIKTITAENKKVIAECKGIIKKARTDIEKFVKGLGPELKKAGLEAQKKMKAKLDQLDKDVNKAEQELKKKLQEKREAAVKAIEKKIEKMKEAMSGLLAKLGNLLLDALLKFFEWALEKAGYSPAQIMDILNKGRAVIKKIVTDPKGFFGNLGTAVGNGINNFKKNIKKHLIKGLISWLTGAMGDSGLVLPEKFDLKGIFGLGLQVMGLTWTFIRSRLVKHVDERIIKAAETGFDIVKRIIKEGPIAIWSMIKEKAAEVKTSIMEGIRNWIIAQIVKKATIKLLSMLNPVGALVQAILTIYDVVMFFVDNWDRIVQFVKSVFNSIVDIAMGNLGKASKMVEDALAVTIPIILSFLARFLGLSGIGKAIRKVIAKVRDPIVKAIDKAAKFLGKKLKKWFGGKKGKKSQEHSPATQKKISEGLSALRSEEKKVAKNGKISREDAEKVAKKIKGKYKVFRSMVVIDGKDSWDYRYKASGAQTLDTPIKKEGEDEGDELVKKIKKRFGKERFYKNEAKKALKKDDVKPGTIDRLFNKLRAAKKLFVYQTGESDSYKMFTLDSNKKGEREIKVKNRRALFGYSNPPHNSETGKAVLADGIDWTAMKNIEGKEKKDIPDKKDWGFLSSAWYKCVRGYGKPFKESEAVMGHAGTGAVGHWNATGMKKNKREDNQKWNKQPSSYHGVEHKSKSSKSGGETKERYEDPKPPKAAKWWYDPTVAGYPKVPGYDWDYRHLERAR